MKTKTKVTTILFCTLLLTMLVAFFMLTMFACQKQPAYAEQLDSGELSSGEVSGNIAETDTVIDENSDDNILGKYGEIIISALLGSGGVTLAGLIVGLFSKLGRFGKTLSSNNIDNGAIKTGINGIADDCELLKQAIAEVKNDNTALLNTLLNNLNTAEGRTKALCQTVAMLVSCSNLPDETKNLLLGTINTALGNKDGDTNDKQE